MCKLEKHFDKNRGRDIYTRKEKDYDILENAHISPYNAPIVDT